MSNEDPVAQRAAAIEAEGKKTHGEEAWSAAMRGVEEQLKSGAIDQTDLVRKMGKADAAAQIFMDGMAAASPADWDAWRNRQPKKAARIAGTKR